MLKPHKTHNHANHRLGASRSGSWSSKYSHKPHKHTFKTRLRAIILKEIQHTPPKATIHTRLPMKGSDDYITARAANPWTGQISPSVAGTPHTPATPGEALKIRKTRDSPSRQHGSPPARSREDIAMRQANEGRKLDGTKVPGKSDVGFWRKYLLSNDSDMVPSAAGSSLARTAVPTNSEDRFVVKMPCAQEPQPYAHPGRSSQQIQAFEHYKHKTRRTSGEGYDRRLMQQFAPAKSRVISSESIPELPIQPTESRSVSNAMSEMLSGTFTPRSDRITRKPVAKLEPDLQLLASETVFMDRHSATSSDQHESAQRQTSGETMIDLIPTTVSARAATEGQHSAVTHLSQLPRVKILHPSLAAMPANELEPRSCSLGCRGGTCAPKKGVERKNESSQTVTDIVTSSRQASANKHVDLAQISTQSIDLFTSSALLVWYSLPTISLMEKQITSLRQCCSKDATIWQVFLAARDLLALFVQCILIVAVLGCIWIIIAVIAKALQIIFLPLGVILHVSRMLLRL